jgi:hypothetical protein
MTYSSTNYFLSPSIYSSDMACKLTFSNNWVEEHLQVRRRDEEKEEALTKMEIRVSGDSANSAVRVEEVLPAAEVGVS